MGLAGPRGPGTCGHRVTLALSPISQQRFEALRSVPDPSQVRGKRAGSRARAQRDGGTRLAACLIFLGCQSRSEKRAQV